MAKVRSDRCFRLEVSDLRDMVDRGWQSGALTWTLGIVDRHEHRYHRIGDAERGALLLEYDTIYHGHQRMVLPYERTPSGYCRRLLWRCPATACGRAVATLFRPHGGAYFLCRHCWSMAYDSQYESKLDRALHWLFDPDYAGRLRASESQYERQLDQLRAETERSRRLLDRFDADRVPRRRGRPSPKRERAERRAATAAERAKRPKRPTGRPLEKRVYQRRSPLVLSERQEDRPEAYCPKCRDRRELVDEKLVTFRNGRLALQGMCAVCRSRMARIVSASERDARTAQAIAPGGRFVKDR